MEVNGGAVEDHGLLGVRVLPEALPQSQPDHHRDIAAFSHGGRTDR